jgi:hypothetical protein
LGNSNLACPGKNLPSYVSNLIHLDMERRTAPFAGVNCEGVAIRARETAKNNYTKKAGK